jgi:hypothetical protein
MRLSPSQLLNTHHYQFDGTHRNRNECALCSMAMLLDQAAAANGYKEFTPPAKLGRFIDRIPFRYPRFPAWFPGPGGATHPIAAFFGLKDCLKQIGLNWSPTLSQRRKPDDLAAALQAGYPTLIYGVGETGVPHVVVPIGKENGVWQILDPGYPRERNPMKWGDTQLARWWRNFSFIYPAGTMVSLTPANDDNAT